QGVLGTTVYRDVRRRRARVALSERTVAGTQGRPGPMGIHVFLVEGAGAERARWIGRPDWHSVPLVPLGAPAGPEGRQGQLHHVHGAAETQACPQTSSLA